jgi:aryl-alcohol dehydrogenase-like predicted oxidoreductase
MVPFIQDARTGEPKPGHRLASPRIASPGGTAMQYRTLGRTGVQVSTLVLGAMNFGAIGRTTQDQATAIVEAALEAGINLIDTADMYGAGESEEMVGRAIAGRRDDIVLATKASMPMGDERNHRGSSRRWLSISTRSTGGTRPPATRRPCRP